MNSIIIAPLGKFVEDLLKSRIGKIIAGTIVVISFLGTLVILLYSLLVETDEQKRKFLLSEVLPFFALPLLIFLFSYILNLTSTAVSIADKQIEKIVSQREEITKKIEKQDSLDIFHTIQLNLNQLSEYYTINLTQAKSSFWCSILSIIIGFITLIVGFVLFYYNESSITVASLASISGILLQFIGGGFFFVYKKSTSQVNYFFGQLIKIQDTMLSINLTEKITDENKKMDVIEKIISSLLERSLK